MGFTFVSMVIAGGLLGGAIHWIGRLSFGDDRMSSLDYRIFIVSGVLCGIAVGTVDFIKNAIRALEDDK